MFDNIDMERAWLFCSGACLVLAALVLWRGHVDAAFIIGVFGAVSWFLSYRVRLKRVIMENSPEPDHEEGSEDEED
jgi:hypothetical protein